MAKIQKITTCLWFDTQAEEAAQYYVSIFKNSSIKRVTKHNEQVLTVQFDLDGRAFTALNGGGGTRPFTEALSLIVHCKNQKEVDYYWQNLIADGGTESMCGWLKDKYGVSWQIIPDALPKLLEHSDPEVAQKAMRNMFQMKKIVIRQLTRTPKKIFVTVQSTIDAPLNTVWEKWTTPTDIMQWNHASDDWHCPDAGQDLRKGGRFFFTMASKDGNHSFVLGGVYDEVTPNSRLAYTLDDGREVTVTFKTKGNKTVVTEKFEAEGIHPVELQRAGWQAILDNFAKYVTSH